MGVISYVFSKKLFSICLSCFDLLIYELITTKWYQSRGGAIGCEVEFIFSFKEIKGVR